MKKMKFVKIKALMAEKELNQTQMAKHLGVNVSTFNLKVNGKRAWTNEEINKIINLFNVPYEQIFLNIKSTAWRSRGNQNASSNLNKLRTSRSN